MCGDMLTVTCGDMLTATCDDLLSVTCVAAYCKVEQTAALPL